MIRIIRSKIPPVASKQSTTSLHHIIEHTKNTTTIFFCCKCTWDVNCPFPNLGKCFQMFFFLLYQLILISAITVCLFVCLLLYSDWLSIYLPIYLFTLTII